MLHVTASSSSAFPIVHESGEAALQSLLAVTAEHFFTEAWEQKPLHARGREPGYFQHLLQLSELDGIVHRARSTFSVEPAPLQNHLDASLLKRVETADGEDWTGKWGKVDSSLTLGVVKAGFNAGFSLLLNEVQQRHRPVAHLCEALEELSGGAPCNANLYLTPSAGRAFETHFDWMDSFVLQLHGRKHWRLYDPLIALPTEGLKYKPSVAELGALPDPIEVVLHEGDVLYLPRGVPHDAHTPRTHAQSLHLTVGLLVGEATTEGQHGRTHVTQCDATC